MLIHRFLQGDVSLAIMEDVSSVRALLTAKAVIARE